MSYTNIVKSLPLHRLYAFIERRSSPTGEFADSFGNYDEVEHYLFAAKSGALIDIQPQKGVVRTIISNSYSSGADNYYPNIFYGWKGNKMLAVDGGGDKTTPNFTVYDPVTGERSFIDVAKTIGRYGMSSNSGGASPAFRVLIGTDGNITGSSARYRAAPSTWYFNTETGEMEFVVKDSMPAYHKMHFTRSSVAFTIPDTDLVFGGTYHNCWWDNSGTDMFTTFVADALANNIVVKGNGRMYIHDSDRALNSPKRRVFASLSVAGGAATWYIIDVKNPSSYYRLYYSNGSPMNVSDGGDPYNGILTALIKNQVATTIPTTGWTKGNLIDQPFNSATTIPKSTFDGSTMYSNSRTAGRFGYTSGYVGNKTFTFCLPIALQDYQTYKKGEIIIPTNWPSIDLSSSFYTGGLSIYLCDFNGVHGFSSSEEYVGFINHPVTKNLGYIRPDNLEFVEYNPTTNSHRVANGGYIIRGPIYPDSGEFGCYYDDITPLSGTTVVDGEEYYYDNVFNRMKSLLKKDTLLKIYQTEDVCDISFTVIPDSQKPWQKYSMGVSTVPTTNGNLLNATEMSENQILFAGLTYSGVLLKERQANDTLTRIYEWSDVVSFKGSLKISDTKILYYGYMSSMDLLTFSNYPNLPSSSAQKISANAFPEISYADKYTDNLVLIIGNFVRALSYVGSYGCFAYVDLSLKKSFIMPNQPIEVRKGSGETMRRALNMTNSTYSDQNAETLFNTYITTNNISRAQGIANIKNTVCWSAQGIEAYKDGSGKFLVVLEWDGYAGMKGFRINANADGSGVWHTDNAVPGTKANTTDVNVYPKVVYIDKADKVLSTIQSSDYKFVTFTELLNAYYVGRPVVTDNYIVFLDHLNNASKAVARVVSKTNFEAAALGSGDIIVDYTIDIPLSSTSSKFGFGSQGGDVHFFNVNGTPRNSYFAIDDYVFVTISSNTPVSGSSYFPAIIRINVVDGTHTVWCVDTVKQAAKGITYNPSTDTALYTRDTTTFRIPNFSTKTTPYLVV